MLGKRDSEEERHRSLSSSSSSPPLTPTDPFPHPMRPAAPRNQRLSSSESFKALLLRKGSRSDLSSRISAVERLRKVPSPAQATDHQSTLTLRQPPDQPQVKPTSLSLTSDTLDSSDHLTLDLASSPTSPCSENFSVRLGLRQRHLRHNHLLFTSSSSPFLFLSSSSMRPRSLTPPCSSSRRFVTRSRLFAAPMTAIFEGESEEEVEDNEILIEAPGIKGELSQRLLEIS